MFHPNGIEILQILTSIVKIRIACEKTAISVRCYKRTDGYIYILVTRWKHRKFQRVCRVYRADYLYDTFHRVAEDRFYPLLFRRDRHFPASELANYVLK